MKSCPTCRNNYPADFSVCPRDATALVDLDAWRDGAVLRGRYRILGKIGEGGMGAVYKAMHTHFQELRALKVIRSDLANDPSFVHRFRQEAVITRKLQHPNAVRVEDIDETEDARPFIVMELIEGQGLKDVIQNEAPMPTTRVCSIIKQAAAGLEAAHRLGIVHRDIKPANIVLVQTPSGEQAKVLDFGIAKLKEGYFGQSRSHMTLTGTGMLVGTPAYMSPEQAMGKRGQELDGRSDLYSLGIVAFQMFTGDLPFKADSDIGFAVAHLQTLPQSIRARRPDIPVAIAEVVMGCLEKSPDRRPASARQLVENLERAEGTTTASAVLPQFRGTVTIPKTEDKPQYPMEAVRPHERQGIAVGKLQDTTDVTPMFVAAAEPKPRIAPYLVAGAIALVVLGAGLSYLFLRPARDSEVQTHEQQRPPQQSAKPTSQQPSPGENYLASVPPVSNANEVARESQSKNVPPGRPAKTTTTPVKVNPPGLIGSLAGAATPSEQIGSLTASTPAPLPKIATPQRVRVSPGVSQGLLIKRVQPIYPAVARAARIQGTVVLQAEINKEGNIENLQMVSGHPLLVSAAMEAVKQWRYKPYVLNGEPVAVDTQIQVNFVLSDN